MPENYVLLETIQLTQSTSSVTFDNIPQTGYTDLKVVISARTDRASVTDDVKVSFNGVTTNLSMRTLFGNGATASSASDTVIYGWINGNSATANTFSNTEVYIPNYTSSSFKSVSMDAVNENNATTAYTALVAGLWSSTAAITSVTLTPYTGPNFVSGSTFSLYGIAAVGTTPAIAPFASGGNIVANDGTYWYHAFLTSGAFIPQKNLSCSVLVIAGGGGGGALHGAGGGAGGLLNSTLSLTNAISYPVVVGAGGPGQASGAMNNLAAKGGTSSISSVSATGGGGGAGYNLIGASGNGESGGSGGGAFSSSTAGAASPSGQGNAGGVGNPGPGYGEGTGGGGGAGAVGGSTSTSWGTPPSGSGGAGVSTYSSWGAATFTGQDISGTRWFAGGGGGASGGYYASNQSGAGGNGGGGKGGYGVAAFVNGISGIANTGGGGGGGSYVGSFASNYGTAGAGGSGIVIIRYPIA